MWDSITNEQRGQQHSSPSVPTIQALNEQQSTSSLEQATPKQKTPFRFCSAGPGKRRCRTHSSNFNLPQPKIPNSKRPPSPSLFFDARKMGEKPVRFGIIGCAEIARKVARAIILAPNYTLSAIASRSIDKATRFAAQNGFLDSVKVYGSHQAILDDLSIDAVYLLLPTSLHVRWAVAAAEKKKHVLPEKSTALHVADLDRILDACRSSGVQFMDCTMWMHHPRTTLMRDAISHPQQFGGLRSMQSSSTYTSTKELLEKDVRVKPDLDSLGALGDTG